MKFHPIRKSWELNEEVLKETDSGVEGSAVVGIEVEDVEGEDVEGVEWEEVEVEDIDEVDEVSTGSSINAPSSPTPSALENDRPLPPSSDDTSMEFSDAIDSGDEVQRQSTLKRKASDELVVEAKSRWKVTRQEGTRVLLDGSGVESNDDGKRSRSATASRRLRESVKSGNFSVDERKRKLFEDKCVKIDRGAQFRYQQDVGWQVLHSKCSKWYRMSEPYNTTRFKLHVEACKVKGDQRNTSITSFFKPRDSNEANTEAKPKITVSARKQIFVGGNASTLKSIKPPHTDNQPISLIQPCLGISDIHDSRVSAYISRTVVEGAGSISLQKVTKQLYGDMKYSELTEEQKATVAVTQSHLRTWTINRELQVIFSANCTKFIEQNQRPPTTICSNCEKVARSEAFGRSLRVKPPPLEAMKFIPIKYRNALADLGTKFAHIQGLSELLKDVSSAFFSSTIANAMTDTHQDPQTSVWVRFVRGVVGGEYNDKLVFLAMIQATIMAHDRGSRGVGLQNMQYQPIYEEFTQMIALTSPRTYRLFAPHIQLPSLRHHR